YLSFTGEDDPGPTADDEADDFGNDKEVVGSTAAHPCRVNFSALASLTSNPEPPRKGCRDVFLRKGGQSGFIGKALPPSAMGRDLPG
ncbi:unnamed protein product, partial [Laminaria digitata]